MALSRAAAEPLPYHPSVEPPRADEAASNAVVVGLMRGILETTWSDYGHSVRSVHAKSHGLLEGELQVLDGLPPHLAQGVFARPARYPAVLRISTNPGDILDDTVSSPRGLAIKIIGVEGERLSGSEGKVTQDFVMANAPAFVAPDVASFSRSLRLLAATTDTGQAWKKLFSLGLRRLGRAMQARGANTGKLRALGGQPLTHPLGETFYSQTPYRYGNYVAKLSVAPATWQLSSLRDAPVDLRHKPNGLRAAVIEHFRDHGAEWEVRVQLRTNPHSMPIEDATVPWPEAESPYVAVARLRVSPQPAWSEARARQADDGLSFSPWHGVVDHQPLGSINRARKDAYAMSAGFRAEHNRCPIQEPASRLAFSSDCAAIYGTTSGREGRRPNTPDARPGSWGQPLKANARRITAGAIGGLAAGTLLSGMMLVLEAAAGTSSELVRLKRRTGAVVLRRKMPEPEAESLSERAGVGEQLAAHGGHLVLSIVAGGIYGAARPEPASPLPAGAAFGLGFYVLAYRLVGPLLGLTPKLRDDTPASVVQHGLLHLVFGLANAWVADRAARRI